MRNARCALLGILLIASGAPEVLADTVLIAHPAVATDEISLNTGRLMFSMQLGQWVDGTPVRVFVLPDDSPIHRAFTKYTLILYPRQLRRVWDRQLYSGTGRAPEIVADETEMRRKVATTEGAIGYLSSEKINDTVKVLSIR